MEKNFDNSLYITKKEYHSTRKTRHLANHIPSHQLLVEMKQVARRLKLYTQNRTWKCDTTTEAEVGDFRTPDPNQN